MLLNFLGSRYRGFSWSQVSTLAHLNSSEAGQVVLGHPVGYRSLVYNYYTTFKLKCSPSYKSAYGSNVNL